MGSSIPAAGGKFPAAALHKLRPHLIPLGLITLAAIVFFAPVLFGGCWLPSGGGDLAVFLWPTYSFASHSLQSGQLPLWNPHLYSGAPFWADNQSSVLYPPTLLVMLLTPVTGLTDVPYQALEALAMFHVWLAGVAMYVCAYCIGASSRFQVPGSKEVTPLLGTRNSELGTRYSSLLAAVLWMFSDGFVTHIGNLNLIAAAAWLPLVMLGAWRALRDLDWRWPRGGTQEPKVSPLGWAILGGAAWGLALLAGHAQIAYFTGLLIGAVGVWWMGVRIWRGVGAHRRLPVPDIFKTLGLLALILALGLGLSAGAWLPALEMTAQTGRAALTYEDASKFSLPIRALVGLVAPWVNGRGPAGFTGGWDRVEVGYIGAVGLAMSLLGAWVAVRRRNGLGIFLAALGVLSFLVALGDHGPLHHLAYDLVPGFKNFRAPARYILLMNFAQALLAGIGLGALMRAGATSPRLRRLPPPGLPSPPGGEGTIERSEIRGEVFAGGYATVVGWLILLLAAAELVGFGAAVEIDKNDPRAGFNHPEAVAWLEAQPDQPFRIDAAPSGLWQSDLAAMHGAPLYDIYGVSNPLALASYEGFYWSVGYRGSPTYNFLGARYVISDGEPPGDATFKRVADMPDGLAIYQNTNALPMAHVVARGVPVESQAKASELAHAPDWDPGRVVYVEGGPPLEADSTSGGSVAYTEYEANRIALRVTTSGPAYLVLSEVYYPGWAAAVDGVDAPVYRANAAFRAVYIESAGTHDVVMEFRPPLVTLGLVVSGVTLLAVIAVVLWKDFSPQRPSGKHTGSRKERKENKG